MTDEWAKKIYQKLSAIDDKLWYIVFLLVFLKWDACEMMHDVHKLVPK